MKKILALFTAAAMLCACAPKTAVDTQPRPAAQQAETSTPIIGRAQVTVKSAMAWAQAHNAAELFIDAAQYYWLYGERTGIRPEVMYAQAALETGYGHYGGSVTPDMNNFAGIKKHDASGDAPEDHEVFAAREDGVRAHFNHMCAYTGLEPIGDVHGRYNIVKTCSWAGTVTTVEDLGGKWCPDPEYGKIIVTKYLADMMNY